jgi:hypothetical protein
MTNIGGQILVFASVRKRSGRTLARLFPSLPENEVRLYYRFAATLKQSMFGYISFEKLTSLWLTH